jgi:hypothetical protein
LRREQELAAEKERKAAAERAALAKQRAEERAQREQAAKRDTASATVTVPTPIHAARLTDGLRTQAQASIEPNPCRDEFMTHLARIEASLGCSIILT